MTTVTITPARLRAQGHLGRPTDYDHWIGYVVQNLEEAVGFEVDVKALPFGIEAPDEGFDAEDKRFPDVATRIVRDALALLWRRFVEENPPDELSAETQSESEP